MDFETAAWRIGASGDLWLIEALYSPSKKIMRAVQWHPELSFQADESSRQIFKEFVTNC